MGESHILQLPQQFLVILFESRVGLAQQRRELAEHAGHVEFVPVGFGNDIGSRHARLAIGAPDLLGGLPLAIQASRDECFEGDLLRRQMLTQQVGLPPAQIR